MGTIVSLALRQFVSTRGLSIVLGLGIVVAATLLALGPIYARAMADLGLTYTIRQQVDAANQSRVEFVRVPLKSPEGIALRQAVEKRIDERVGWFRKSQFRTVRLGRLRQAEVGKPSPARPNLIEPVGFQGWEQKVKVLQGTLPQRNDTGVLEIALSRQAATTARLAVGDTIELREDFDNCEREIPVEDFPPPPPPCPITERIQLSVTAKVTALVEPIDPRDAYWLGGAQRYFETYFVRIENVGPVIPVLADEQAIVEDFGSRFPNYIVTASWAIAANTDVLTRTNFERARDDLTALYAEMEPLNAFAVSPLRDTLIAYGKTADYQQVPLIVLLLEITGIALFYVALVSAIVVERQSNEISLLRGRGASIFQVLAMYVVQGLVIGIPTLFFAPFLAGAVTGLLGLTPLFNDVSDGELLPVTIVPLSFATAALGIGLSLIALVLPALASSLKGVQSVRRGFSRPIASVFTRYYLDIAFAVVAILLLIELRERGSVFEPSSTGGVTSDPLLLASPALAIAAAGALILRFYPLLLRLIARGTTIVSGAPFTLAMTQVVRNAGQYTRLSLLLMMAVAVGTFAASYTRTADRSYQDRANYEAGVDLRVSTSNQGPLTGVTDKEAFETNALKLPGVRASTAVIRSEGGPAAAGTSQAIYQVLAVDPGKAGTMLWSRDDLAGRPLKDLLLAIDGLPAGPGKQLPEGATELRVWARSDDPTPGHNMRAGFRDAKGNYAQVLIIEMEQVTKDWAEFRVPMKFQVEMTPPLLLVSLTVTGLANRPGGSSITLDDLAAVDASGRSVVLEDWEGAPQWGPFPSPAQVPDQYSIVTTAPHGGRQAGKLQLRSGSVPEVRGIYLAGFLTPLPALVSDSYLASTGLKVGAQALLRVGGVLVPTVIRGRFELFPTTTSLDGPLIIYNRDRLEEWTDLAFPGLGNQPEKNELWLSLAPDADVNALTAAFAEAPFRLEDSVSRSQAIANATKNPLIAASGSGVLFAAFGAVLALVAAALLTSLMAAVRRRKVEFAVVRVIGLTRSGLLSMLLVEYAVVFIVGVSVGCGMGLFVSDRMLSFLDVTETGDRVEPGYILETRWWLVGLGVAVVLAVFMLAVWLASRVVARGGEGTVLRGE